MTRARDFEAEVEISTFSTSAQDHEPGAPGAVAVAESKPEPERRWVSAESFLETLDPEREAPAHRDYLSNRGKPGPWVRT